MQTRYFNIDVSEKQIVKMPLLQNKRKKAGVLFKANYSVITTNDSVTAIKLIAKGT